MTPPQPDDLFTFIEDEPTSGAGWSEETTCWKILVVDDDQDVHLTTRLALKGQIICGKPLQIASADSADTAKALLQQQQFACILMDVVMETDDTGLQLVEFIRKQLKEESSRIILRTGQPGYAPEIDVIEQYDINDYKCKDELTRTRLITTLTAAIRSFQQISTIKASREGLAMIINGAPTLFQEREVGTFAKGVLLQICSLLHIKRQGFLCCQQNPQQDLQVLAAYGDYRPLAGHLLTTDSQHYQALQQVLHTKQHLIRDNYAILYVPSPYADGLIIQVDTQHPLSDNDLDLLSLFSVSVSVGFDNARLFERTESLAYTDPLTGLPNRTGYLSQLGKRIEQQTPFFLLLADIDNFQAVNDGLGYSIGNLTLKQVATYLSRWFGAGTLTARLSADTFCVILPGMSSVELKDTLKRLEQSLAESFNVDDYEIPVSLTIGVAHYPSHGNDGQTLLQNASIALKHAKRSRRAGYALFDHAYEQQLQQRLHIATQLRHCVEKAELELLYQPQVELASGRLTGAEALVRWHHDGRVIPPGEFISVAESTGYIVPMGYWILEHACRQQVSWQAECGKALDIAVNVSVRQLQDPHFLQQLDRILADTAICRQRLTLEITESVTMEDGENFEQILSLIRRRNVRIALDDFGTGYSSLSYLQQLPVDYLKIDRSFIRKITHREQDNAIAALIIRMGELLNMDVIAEGVETQEQQQALLRMGCPRAQGFWYAKPLRNTDFVALVSHSGKLR